MIDMKQRFVHRILLILLLEAGLISASFGQTGSDSALADIAVRYPENLVVFTDRDLYVVNESILFSILIQSDGKPYSGVGSKIVYVELVNASGETFAKGKYPMKENRSAGHLIVPAYLPAGIYYLRSYTRWMRNFGASKYSYIPLRILNPYSNEETENRATNGNNTLQAAYSGSQGVSCFSDRHSYHPGETVEVELALADDVYKPVVHGCLTVVPIGAIDTSVFVYGVDERRESSSGFKLDYLPEIHGASISGMVQEPGSSLPVSDIRVHISLLGEQPAYFVKESGPQGRVNFKIPSLTGIQEMFVVPEHPEGELLDLLIDNDFSTEALPFQPDRLQMNDVEEKLASRMALNMQLREAYLKDSVLEELKYTPHSKNLPFYGIPEISVAMDEFVSLPSLIEVFENLIPNTFVVRNSGELQFLIKSENPMISMFPPLILIDHIPVFDKEAIMSIPPSKIDHIDVIPEVYVLGEVKYGGIISFTSREKDLASVKLPEGSYFFDYLALQPERLPQGARYPGPGRIPDVRNTLYWNEHLKLDKDKSSRISFRAASLPGSYVILFRGISSNGDLVHGMDQFRVE